MQSVKCASYQCNVGGSIECIITARDEYGNPTTSANTLSYMFTTSRIQAITTAPQVTIDGAQYSILGIGSVSGGHPDSPTISVAIDCNGEDTKPYPQTGTVTFNSPNNQAAAQQVSITIVQKGVIDKSQTTLSCGYKYVVAGSDVTCRITTRDSEGSAASSYQLGTNGYSGAMASEFTATPVGEAGPVESVTALSDGTSFAVSFSTATSGMAQCLSYFDVCRAGVSVQYGGYTFTETVAVLAQPSQLSNCPVATTGLRSQPPGRTVDLTFLNNAGEAISICWVNYQGTEGDFTKVLQPHRFAKVAAYDAHAFRVRRGGCSTGQLLLEISSVVGAASQLEDASAARTIVVQNCAAPSTEIV